MVSRSEIVVELRRNGSFSFVGLYVYQLLPAQIVSSIAFRRAGLLQILGRARQWQTFAYPICLPEASCACEGFAFLGLFYGLGKFCCKAV